MRLTIPLTGFVCLLCSNLASGNRITELERALEQTGKHHLSLSVAAPNGETIIPVTVISGPKAGPTLLVLAGIHGSEYGPILAVQRLASELEAEQLQGAVILVHVANMPAFQGRTVYISPVDGKNLNRLFPGDANGSLSQRIAFTITKRLYPLADAVLDMHSGDANEDLRPYWTGYYSNAGSAETITQSRAMAFAFGLQHVVEFQWALTDPAKAIWAGSAAVAMNIPSIDVEAGGSGRIDESAIAALQSGVRRIMTHLGIDNTNHPPAPPVWLIRERQSITSPQDGSWTPLLTAGEPVEQGQLIGYLTDWYGRRQYEARAPMDGLLMICLSTPPVHQGETLAVVGRVEPAMVEP